MARLNKFASANLNDSYGKPDRGGSARSRSNGNPAASGKPRISSPGGMLVLSRPGRSQPPSPPPKPGQARLGVPSPVNLPSMKRETSDGDALPASPPIAGWSRAESPHLTVSFTKPGQISSDELASQQKAVCSRSLDTVGEALKAISAGRSDVYAPPAMRMAMQAASVTLQSPTPPQHEKASPVIRGDEFPTLQAAAARPPTPPQHPRQKDLHQKQRERQQEVKEQRLKLQQLSLAQEHKQVQPDVSQSGNEKFPSHSSTLSLRPLGRPESAFQKTSIPGRSSPSSSSTQGSSLHPERSLSSLISTDNSSLVQNNARNARDTSPPTADTSSHGILGGMGDAGDAGHSFRPQYRSSPIMKLSSTSMEAQQSGSQMNTTDSSRLPSFRWDIVPMIVDEAHSNCTGALPTSNVGDKPGSVAECGQLAKDSYLRKDGNCTIGIIRENTYADQQGSVKEMTDTRFCGRLPVDIVPHVEGFYSQRSFAREMQNMNMRKGRNGRGEREYFTMENCGSHNVDAMDSSHNAIMDMREAYCQDSHHVHSLGSTEACTPNPAFIRKPGYGHPVTSFDDSSLRGHASNVNSYCGRIIESPAGISATHYPGRVFDTHYGKRYGSQGTDDQNFTGELNASTDPRFHPSPCMKQTDLYSSNAELLVSSRSRSPVSSSRSYNPVKESREICNERDRPILEHRQGSYEDKVVDAKGGSSQSSGLVVHMQRPVTKRDSIQGYGVRFSHMSSDNKLDDERSHLEDANKHMLEDERRKEAAKLKLTELEERIARRAAIARKEIEVKLEEPLMEALTQKKLEAEPSGMSADYVVNGIAALQHTDNDSKWRDGNSGPNLDRPRLLSVSSVSLGNLKNPNEGKVPYQEHDSRFFVEGEGNQGRRMLRPRSPSSWRKEVGSGPTSKLFSSPYTESGGFRRASDGGAYKLF